LVRTLAKELGSKLRLNSEVLGITVRRQAGNITFELRVRQAGNEETLVAERLVMATPAHVAGILLRDVNAAFEPVLGGIEYAPVAVVSLGYRRAEVGHSLNGFGFLVPRPAGLKILGTVWSSSLFPNRAPTDHIQLTSFLGGATDPDTVSLADSSLVDLAHRELTPVLGLKARPTISRVTAYENAIPQYNLGHTARIATIRAGLANVPGLYAVGNYLRGPAIGACIEHAQAVAESIRTGSRPAAFGVAP
jgi:oxygen-dependent protoporphyrinogen oxidase